jgi:ABC-type glycerol-3-phosphate transport system substrate-binding protein
MKDCQQQQEQRQQTSRRSLTEANETSCCDTCTNIQTIRIATWSTIAPTLQAYVDAYNAKQKYNNAEIRLAVLPTVKDLAAEAIFDLQAVDTALYDGFVVPPFVMGSMFEKQGLVNLNDNVQGNNAHDDILPYYKDHVGMYDGNVRMVPLFAGSQLVLFYRKDWLEEEGFVPPRTWTEYIRVAAALHNKPIGPNNETAVGSCLGRISEKACRQRIDQSGEACQSLSMSYLGVMLASINQVDGSETGWWLENSNNTPNGNGTLSSLLEPSLDMVMLLMENLMKYGHEDELTRDSSLNIESFQSGKCALTISANHPKRLLESEKQVGYGRVPGSANILNRENRTLEQCTIENCPHGLDDEDWGRINYTPFGGVTDAFMAAISDLASQENKDVVRDFFSFAWQTKLDEAFPVAREQPLTGVDLEALRGDFPAYVQLIKNLTKSENAAIPFRIPQSFDMFTEMDNRVYQYLVDGNFSAEGRASVRKSVERKWDFIIETHDDAFGAIKLQTFHEKSLGTFTPEPANDLYIGTASRAVGWTLCGISMFTSLAMAAWVWYYRTDRVVRASQPIFLWMLCLGTLIMATSIFPFGVEDDIASYRGVDISCMASLWLYSLGYVMKTFVQRLFRWHCSNDGSDCCLFFFCDNSIQICNCLLGAL